MKPILAIETSTSTCHIALWQPQATPAVLHEQALAGIAGHAESVLPLIDAVLTQADMDRSALGLVAFGQGPGAFTGIRLGCSVAQSIAFALNLPLVTVGALQAVATQFATESDAIRIVALDARMDELYLAVYGSGLTELQSPVLLGAADVERFITPRLPYWLRHAKTREPAQLVGQGWQVVSRCLSEAGMKNLMAQPLKWRDQEALPTAKAVAHLALERWQSGQTIAPERALPLYLRDKVAFTTQERAQGQGLGGNPRVATPDTDLLLPMSSHDLREVVELELQSQAFPWSYRNFEDALKAGYPAWVIRRDHALVGFCVAMPTPDEMHVLVIAVSADHRRQGIGTILLNQVNLTATMAAMTRVLLEVRPSNERALHFYQSKGFEQIGLRKGYYPAAKAQREDAIVMARRLGEA
jgi:tRNA threonylcarbamoyladenosine biosynthesis protein TsaB